MPKEFKERPQRSVLIVEDSVDFSNLLKFIVEDDGFAGIQFPPDGSDVIGWAKEHKPAVILMDLALRRKEGMDFVEQLKADPATKAIPIIIITGRELSQKEVISLQMKGVKYLRKGRVELDEIKAEIRASAAARSAPPAGSKK